MHVFMILLARLQLRDLVSVLFTFSCAGVVINGHLRYEKVVIAFDHML